MNIFLVNKAWMLVVFPFFGGFLKAQNVATINGIPVSASEFLWVYQKNNAKENKLNYKELTAYLDLYVNFKLKVAEAKALGLDKEEAYKQEIAGYETALMAQGKTFTPPHAYTYIMNEYREGVLMFNISEQKIWNSVADDDQLLKAFYNKESNKYNGKAFDDIRGEIVGDYQLQLEKDWIKALRTKYTITINQAELKKLARQ